MDLVQFHRVRTAIQDNAAPGTPSDRATLEGSLRHMLLTSGLFEKVEVEATADPDQLVIALCRFLPFVSEAEVAAKLEHLWSHRVSFPFWEAHALGVGTDHVEFEAASRPSIDAGYVTVHLVAEKASIPAQRSASSNGTRELSGR